VLLEYAAYRLYNALTPHSFRVRLATIDYVDDSGRPHATRVGFFIEDVDDLAQRNGLVEATSGERVPLARIEPGGRRPLRDVQLSDRQPRLVDARGPAGRQLLPQRPPDRRQQGPDAVATRSPMTLTSQGWSTRPYATPPEGFNMRSVRQRLYRGYCAHSAQAPAVGFGNRCQARRAARAFSAPSAASTSAAAPGAAAYLDGRVQRHRDRQAARQVRRLIRPSGFSGPAARFRRSRR
jgi:hypothetical protein